MARGEFVRKVLLLYIAVCIYWWHHILTFSLSSCRVQMRAPQSLEAASTCRHYRKKGKGGG